MQHHIRPRRDEGPIADPPGLGDVPIFRPVSWLSVLMWVCLVVVGVIGTVGIVLRFVL